jgi:hypothetical protein
MNELKKNLLELRLRVLARVGTRLGYDVDQHWVREAASSMTDKEILHRLKLRHSWRWRWHHGKEPRITKAREKRKPEPPITRISPPPKQKGSFISFSWGEKRLWPR